MEVKDAHVEGVDGVTKSPSPPGSKTTGAVGVKMGLGGIAHDAAAPRHFGWRSGWLFKKLAIIFFSLFVDASRWSPRHWPGDMEQPSAVLNQAQSRLPALGEVPRVDDCGEGAGVAVTIRAGAGAAPEGEAVAGGPAVGEIVFFAPGKGGRHSGTLPVPRMSKTSALKGEETLRSGNGSFSALRSDPRPSHSPMRTRRKRWATNAWHRLAM